MTSIQERAEEATPALGKTKKLYPPDAPLERRWAADPIALACECIIVAGGVATE